MTPSPQSNSWGIPWKGRSSWVGRTEKLGEAVGAEPVQGPESRLESGPAGQRAQSHSHFELSKDQPLPCQELHAIPHLHVSPSKGPGRKGSDEKNECKTPGQKIVLENLSALQAEAVWAWRRLTPHSISGPCWIKLLTELSRVLQPQPILSCLATNQLSWLLLWARISRALRKKFPLQGYF